MSEQRTGEAQPRMCGHPSYLGGCDYCMWRAGEPRTSEARCTCGYVPPPSYSWASDCPVHGCEARERERQRSETPQGLHTGTGDCGLCGGGICPCAKKLLRQKSENEQKVIDLAKHFVDGVKEVIAKGKPADAPWLHTWASLWTAEATGAEMRDVSIALGFDLAEIQAQANARALRPEPVRPTATGDDDTCDYCEKPALFYNSGDQTCDGVRCGNAAREGQPKKQRRERATTHLDFEALWAEQKAISERMSIALEEILQITDRSYHSVEMREDIREIVDRGLGKEGT